MAEKSAKPPARLTGLDYGHPARPRPAGSTPTCRSSGAALNYDVRCATLPVLYNRSTLGPAWIILETRSSPP